MIKIISKVVLDYLFQEKMFIKVPSNAKEINRISPEATVKYS